MGNGTETIRMIDDHGNTVDVPVTDAEVAAAKGYRAETSAESFGRAQESARELQYESGAGKLAAGAAGLARGLTMGLSDPFAIEMGAATAEDLRELQARNKGISTVSEIAGAAVPALLSGGSSLAGSGGSVGRSLGAQILRSTPSGLAARAGEALAAKGVGKSAISEILHAGAGYGVEGALFSSGQYLSDVALEKRELSAEGFVAAAGQGAMFGGGIGAGMSAAARGWGSLSRAASALRKGEAVENTTLAKVIPRRSKSAKSRMAKQKALEEEMARQIASGESLASMAEEIFKQEGAKASAIARAERRAAAAARKAEKTAQQAEREAIADIRGGVPDDVGALSAKERAQRAMAEIGDDAAPVSARAPKQRLTAKERIARAKAGLDDGADVGDDLLGRQLRESVDGPAPLGLDDMDGLIESYDSAQRGRTAHDELFASLRPKVDRLTASREKAMKWVENIKAKNPTTPGLKARGAVGREFGDAAGARGVFMDQVAGARAMDDILDQWQPMSPMGASKKATDQAMGFDPVTGEVFEDIWDVAAYEKAQFELADELKKHVSPDEFQRLDDTVKPYADAKAKHAVAEGAKSEARSILSSAQDAAGMYEFLQAAGVPVPDIDGVPVIGPLLSTYLKARLVMGKLGGTKILASPTAKVAEKSAGVRNRISDALEKLAKGGEKVGKKLKPAKKAVVPAFSVLSSSLYSDPEAPRRSKAPADSDAPKKQSAMAKAAKDYEKRLDELYRAVTDPETVRRRITSQLQMGDEAMENAIADAALRKLQFLYDKAPKDPRPPNPLGMPDRPWRPDRVELEKFARYMQAAEDPASVIERAADGDVSFEAAETLRKVYPELFREVQAELADNLAEYRTDLPYARRVSLSVLFDVPVESTMSPAFLAAMQEGFLEPSQQPQSQPPQPTVNPGVASNLGEMTMSGTLRRAAL